jgi:hypothetical protein
MSSFMKDDRWPDFHRVAQCDGATSLTVRPSSARLRAAGHVVEDLATLYTGEGDAVRDHIDSHAQSKEFWEGESAPKRDPFRN